ncbi:PREDICTED: hepatitis A virus cellular receptor 1-like isoform X1 [Branchiostoma belcheri]|uniref:Hepatitis A virus cellular receptor 1-like isoform X1 n=1 Tax=Branchiostoma belcheri TaxID=7741 RepID=A0A6P4XUY9_BRABE|nr:PREDICTED: hepatitis A virus cellular receptor 1-like isoform X1 [Branchiostoma belcheri]
MLPAIFSVSLLFVITSAAAGPPTTSVPFVWPTKTTSPTLPTKTTSPTLPCRDYLRFVCPQLNCPDAVPHNYARCLCGYCPNGPMTTVPTTVQTPTQATAAPALKNMPTLRTTERTTTAAPETTTTPFYTTPNFCYPMPSWCCYRGVPRCTFTTSTTPLPTLLTTTTIPMTTPTPFTTLPLPCLLRGLTYTCRDPPCVDKTAHNSFACSCGTCPTGPNCYAWDGSIIPAGEPVAVDGAMCECSWKNWGDRFSPYATCRWGVLSG